jgi:hypothetical protein
MTPEDLIFRVGFGRSYFVWEDGFQKFALKEGTGKREFERAVGRTPVKRERVQITKEQHKAFIAPTSKKH